MILFIISSLNVSMLLHAHMHVCVCLPALCVWLVEGAVDYCRRVSGDPMLPWCPGFQGAMIIHCVKTNIRQIRLTAFREIGLKQLSLHFIPRGMITWFLDYCIIESVTQSLWVKAVGTPYGTQGEFYVSAFYLFFLTNYPQTKSSLLLCSRCCHRYECV